MAIREYIGTTGGKCEVCGDSGDDCQIVYDDDGHEVCTDCLFEKQSMEGYDET